MKTRSKAPVWVTAGLVAGLTLGSLGVASAAPAVDPATGESLGLGMRMGVTIRDAGARLIDILADLTGLSVDDIADRRAEGESIADIAETEGVDAGTVVDEALDVREELLDEKVADGTITVEQRDFMLDRMTDRLDERVTSTDVGVCGGEVGGRGGRGGGARGMGGAGGAGACGGGTCITSDAADPATF